MNTSFLKKVIVVVSILIPVIVTVLIFKPQSFFSLNEESNFNIHFFPKLHAVLNSLTAACLILSLFFIRQKKVFLHKFFNWSAVALSSLFLISYVLYHSMAPSVKFGDINHDNIVDAFEKIQAGNLRYFYYFVLLTHILLACVIVPLVLFTLLAIYKISIERHRKIAKITWPLWLYVAITGVVVYFLISPYY